MLFFVRELCELTRIITQKRSQNSKGCRNKLGNPVVGLDRTMAGILFLCIVSTVPVWSDEHPELTIVKEDLRIEQRVDGGFHLFIRKKPEINSVLITESTKDPALKEPNYAYRVSEWNEVNGSETRLLIDEITLKDRTLPLPNKFLVDSTPEADLQFGEAFHIFIPYILNFGYSEWRSGELYVKEGTYFNIRAFSKPYSDYRGSFRDNPFVLTVTQDPLPGPPDSNYRTNTWKTFSEISEAGKGEMVLSKGPDDIVDIIKDILLKEPQPFDLVICLDTTGSMKDDIAAIKASLSAMLASIRDPHSRVGMVLYKDYGREEYLTRIIPFTKDLAALQSSLNKIRAGGGNDTPEAVHEALYAALTKFDWEAESRVVVLIGDAEPHPRPLGKITFDMVIGAAEEQEVKLYTIVLPQ